MGASLGMVLACEDDALDFVQKKYPCRDEAALRKMIGELEKQSDANGLTSKPGINLVCENVVSAYRKII